MWNMDGDDPVPTMGDFNRERRFFRISEVMDFAKASIEKYEALSTEGQDEFEDYQLATIENKATGKVEIKAAQFFAIKMNGDQQNAEDLLVNMKKPEGDEAWPEPLGLTPEGFKNWLKDIKEFQIQYNDITIKYPVSSGHARCYNWNLV